MLENMQKNECRVVLPPRSLAFGNWKRECIKTVLRILQRLCCNEVMVFFFLFDINMSILNLLAKETIFLANLKAILLPLVLQLLSNLPHFFPKESQLYLYPVS
jgi:hypothetical protein